MRRRWLFGMAWLIGVLPWLLPANAIASDAVTMVTLRRDALIKGYTVVHSNGTAWVGVPRRALTGTKRARIKLARVAAAERFLGEGEVQPITDLYRFSVNSAQTFRLKRRLHLRLAYPAADIGVKKVLKYWDQDRNQWRRVQHSSDDPSTLTVSGELRRKFSVLAVFPKANNSPVVRGLASWYDWTGAATNDFPIGSTVRVTNVANGVDVDTTVVSAGPFIPGRVVDLPRDQFSQIADLSIGVVEVTVQQISE